MLKEILEDGINLEGKTIKAFYDAGGAAIISFTDGTFTCISVDMDGEDPIIETRTSWLSLLATQHISLRDLKLAEVITDEEEKTMKAERDSKEKERRHQEYERLKKEFES
jgi:hypothetical protein